jgi:hypothetical protein
VHSLPFCPDLLRSFISRSRVSPIDDRLKLLLSPRQSRGPWPCRPTRRTVYLGDTFRATELLLGTASVPLNYFGSLIPQISQVVPRAALMSPWIAFQLNMPNVIHGKTLYIHRRACGFSRPLFLQQVHAEGPMIVQRDNRYALTRSALAMFLKISDRSDQAFWSACRTFCPNFSAHSACELCADRS